MADFYVYVYIDPRDGTPFYIGKGHGNRDRSHLFPCNLKQNQFFYHKINKLLKQDVNPKVRRIFENLSEQEAFFWETFFIHALGRRNLDEGPLCNLTNGGDGFAGYVVTPERRQQAAEAARRTKNNAGRKHSETTKKLLAEIARKRNLGRKLSEGTKEKIGLANRGRKHTADTRKRMSAGQKRRYENPKERSKISKSQIGRRHSETTRKKMSKAHKGKECSFISIDSQVTNVG